MKKKIIKGKTEPTNQVKFKAQTIFGEKKESKNMLLDRKICFGTHDSNLVL